MANEAASLDTQNGWLDGYTSRPFDLSNKTTDYRTGYRAGEKSKTRDAARKRAAAIVEVRARNESTLES